MRKLTAVAVALLITLQTLHAATLIARYEFDQGDGHDSSGVGSGKDLSVIGAPVFGPAGSGRLGGADRAVFLNTDFLESVSPDFDISGNAVTLMCWIRGADQALDQTMVIISKADNGGSNFSFEINFADNLLFARGSGAGPDVSGFDIDNSWHHLAVTLKSGAGAEGTIYVDGVQAASTPPNAFNQQSGHLPLRIGASSAAPQRSVFHGWLDDVRIYSGAMTASEVRAAAKIKVWQGPQGNDNWNTIANWADSVAPASGDTLVFGATPTSTNNMAGQNLAQIKFSGGGGALKGNLLTLTSPTPISVNKLGGAAGDVAVSAQITFTQDSEIFTGPPASGSLTFLAAAKLDNGGHTLTFKLDDDCGVDSLIVGSGGVVKAHSSPNSGGAGALVLSGTNTYSGSTTINAGTLRLGNANVIPDTSTVQVDSGASLDLNGKIENIGALGDGANGGGTITTLLNDDATVRTVSNASSAFHGLIQDNGTGKVAIVKQGNGTLQLFGANTYSGGTNISAGVLEARNTAGLATGTGLVTLNGGSLSGNGSVANVGVNIGGQIAPGAVSPSATAILRTGNIAFNSTPAITVRLNGTTPGTEYDQIVVTGTINLAGADLNVSVGFDPPNNVPFIIISNDGADAVTGTFSGLAEGAILAANDKALKITYHGGDGNDVALQALTQVKNVTSSVADGAYGVGEVIPIEVEFNGTVTVDTLNGTPTLEIRTGVSQSREAPYDANASSASKLVFKYTVNAGDRNLDLDYVTTSAIALHTATIRDSSNNNASLTLPAPGAAGSLSANKNILVGSAPLAVIVEKATAQTDPTNDSPIKFVISFERAVTDFDESDITLSGTVGGTLDAAIQNSSGGRIFDVDITGMDGAGTVVISVVANKAHDGANNANSASNSVQVAFDNVPPLVTVAADNGQSDPANSTPVNFKITFSKPVTGLTKDAFDLSGSSTQGSASATLQNTDGGTGAQYQLSISGISGKGNVSVSLAADEVFDAIGNGNAAANGAIAFDDIRPDVTVFRAPGQSDPANGSTVVFRIVFGEPVQNFDIADVDVSASTLPNVPHVQSVTMVSADDYRVALDQLNGEGDVVCKIVAGAVQDAAGNSNLASNSVAITYDNVAPTATLTSSAPQTTGTSPIPVTATFTEAVTGFTVDDITVTNATIANFQTGSSTSFSFDLVPNDVGVVTAAIAAGAATDAVGNSNPVSQTLTRTYQIAQEPPLITSSLSLTANVGDGFQYVPTATGSPKPVIAVISSPASPNGLPDGLGISAQQDGSISGTLLKGGSFLFRLQAANTAGVDTQDVLLNVLKTSNPAAPVISSATATPNPVFAGTPAQFTVVASDADGDMLSYNWDFGDGIHSREQNPQHTYFVQQTFTARVTVSDGQKTAEQAVAITVTGKKGVSSQFVIAKAQFSFNFVKPGKHSVSLTGGVRVPNPLVSGTRFVMSMGKPPTPTTRDLPLIKGSAKNTTTQIKVSPSINGAGVSIAKLTVKLINATLFDELTSCGFVNETVTNRSVTVPITVQLIPPGTLPNPLPEHLQPQKYDLVVTYTAKAGKSGKAKK